MIPASGLALFSELGLTSSSVGLQSAYIAGAQPEVDDLRRVMWIDGSRLRHPQDPGNTAEISFWFGMGELLRDDECHAMPVTKEQVLGVVAIAGMSVLEKFDTLGMSRTALVVPMLYRVVMPRTFGNVSNFEPQILYDQLAETAGISQRVC